MQIFVMFLWSFVIRAIPFRKGLSGIVCFASLVAIMVALMYNSNIITEEVMLFIDLIK